MDALNRENEENSQEHLRVEIKDKKNILINRIVAIAILSIALLLGYWGLWKYKSTTNKMEAELIEIEFKHEVKRKTIDLIDKAKTSKQYGRYAEALGFYEKAKLLSPGFPNIDRLILDIKKKIDDERRILVDVEKKEAERRKKAMDLTDKAEGTKEYGISTKGKLGIIAQTITTQLQESFGLKDNLGVLVSDIEPNSPAAIAGIKRGDVIIKYNGMMVKNPTHLKSLVTGTETSKVEEIVVIRDGKELTLNTAIKETPKGENESAVEKEKEKLSYDTASPSKPDKISNISHLILGQWQDEDAVIEYFKDGTFVSNAYTGEKYTGSWSVINNTLRVQFLTPQPVLNVYTIIELTDTTLKTKLNGLDGRTYSCRRVKPYYNEQNTLGHNKSKSEEEISKGVNTDQIRMEKTKPSLNPNSVFASRNSRIYHKPNCPLLNKEDLIEFTSPQKAQEAGGIPCKYCNPSAFDRENATDDRRDRRRNPFDDFFDRFFPQVPSK